MRPLGIPPTTLLSFSQTPDTKEQLCSAPDHQRPESQVTSTTETSPCCLSISVVMWDVFGAHSSLDSFVMTINDARVSKAWRSSAPASQNTPLWYIESFELKTLKNQHLQDRLADLPFSSQKGIIQFSTRNVFLAHAYWYQNEAMLNTPAKTALIFHELRHGPPLSLPSWLP